MIYEDVDRTGESICVGELLWDMLMSTGDQLKNTLACGNVSLRD